VATDILLIYTDSSQLLRRTESILTKMHWRLPAAMGIASMRARFEEVELPRDYFDLVTATHVIEHVPDPMELPGKHFLFLNRVEYFGSKLQI